MSRQFNAWLGLGSALYDANRQWDTKLMPEFIAAVAEVMAAVYAHDPSLDFEKVLEQHVYLNLPDFTEDEMHAAKYAVGKIFGENRKNRRAEKRKEERSYEEFVARHD